MKFVKLNLENIEHKRLTTKKEETRKLMGLSKLSWENFILMKCEVMRK